MRFLIGILFLFLFVISGCVQVPKEAGFGNVQKLVHQKIDYRLYWNQGLAADEQVTRAIDDLLKKELSVDEAVQIALLNNQHLQAVYSKPVCWKIRYSSGRSGFRINHPA
jgi:cobalt-zinc-cadmium efflux system outer membrane protein